jgi:hypothetical protein
VVGKTSERDALIEFMDTHELWEDKPVVGPEDAGAIAELLTYESFKVLQNELLRRRDSYFQNLSRGLTNNRNLVDQREIDEKRGFWYGALWATTVLPRTMKRRAEKPDQPEGVDS